MKIRFLKAGNGDAILIRLTDQGKPRNILIDGGLSTTYLVTKNKKGKPEDGALKEVVDEIREQDQRIDLLVMTHVDDDHIGGILRWFQKDLEAYKLIDKVWFNSGRLIAEHFLEAPDKESEIVLNISRNSNTSIGQGIKFEKYLEENKLWERVLLYGGMQRECFGVQFNMLSPDETRLKTLLKKWEKEKPDYKTSGKKNDYHLSLKEHMEKDTFKEDNAAHNGSSIAFNLSYRGKNWLFLADAYPTVVIAALKNLGYSKENPIKAELVKLSHHGSKSNNNRELLEMIRASKFVVSTDGNKHNHPDKQMLSRLIAVHPHCEIYFNYGEQIDKVFTPEDRRDFPFFEPKAIVEDFSYAHNA